MDNNKKLSYLSLGFAIIVIIAVVGLFITVNQMPEDAKECLLNPIAYAEKEISLEKDYEVSCICSEKKGILGGIYG